MPIYEYQCQACGHTLEKLQKMSDAPLLICPDCGKECLKKLISAAAFQLKGDGWYVTDFRDKGKANKEAGTSTDTGAGSSTDTKTGQTNAAANADKAPAGSGDKSQSAGVGGADRSSAVKGPQKNTSRAEKTSSVNTRRDHPR